MNVRKIYDINNSSHSEPLSATLQVLFLPPPPPSPLITSFHPTKRSLHYSPCHPYLPTSKQFYGNTKESFSNSLEIIDNLRRAILPYNFF